MRRSRCGRRSILGSLCAKLPGAALAAIAFLSLPASGSAGALTGPGDRAPGERSPGAIRDRFALANRCFAIASRGNGDFVAIAGANGYRADAHQKADAAAFFLKPTGLGAYLISDQDGQLISIGARPHPRDRRGDVGRSDTPSKQAEWAPTRTSKAGFAIASTADGRRLSVGPGGGALILSAPRSAGRPESFAFVPNRGCRRYPEAAAAAVGKPFAGTNPDGTVFGFADMHLHITAEMRAGGRVIGGEPFNRFGITRALGDDARDHGADGSLDVTGNLLRTGLPFGTHDTHGWPTFAGWPVNDTNTHTQTYYGWLKRAWKAGLRVAVAQTVEDEPLCRIEPLKSHSCDETHTIKLEIRELEALQDYVDAQSGGPGRGWFRLVYGPGEARRVIEQGKLAVVIGVESSDVLGCSEGAGCTRADVDRGIAKLRRLGVRSLFVAHWVDNAFAGAALEGGVKGTFINVFDEIETGHYFRTGPCPDPSQGEEIDTLGPLEMQVLGEFFPATAGIEPMPTYPPGRQCNAKGLTKLGAYLIRKLIAAHMLIEVDHMSERARARVLAIAAAHRYPLISSHTGTGGAWTPSELKRLYALGGLAAATPDPAPELADKILGFGRYRSPRHYFGVGLGTDTGGFSSLPGPRADAGADPLPYPFESYDRRVEFNRQRTGDRVYDLNTDGVAQYGLFADLIADMQRTEPGEAAERTLFRSAEAYLQTWRLAIEPR